jgi:hypothetical protein
MKVALHDLGYRGVYHMTETFSQPTHPEQWIRALNAKYSPSTSPPFTNEDWDNLLGSYSVNLPLLPPNQYFPCMSIPSQKYSKLSTNTITSQAVSDLPSACFAPELLNLYPNAKIILTTRPTLIWHESIISTIHALQTSTFDRFLLNFRSAHTKSLSKLMTIIIQYYFNGSIATYGSQVFEEHNKMVRDLAKKNEREFLEFRWVLSSLVFGV